MAFYFTLLYYTIPNSWTIYINTLVIEKYDTSDIIIKKSSENKIRNALAANSVKSYLKTKFLRSKLVFFLDNSLIKPYDL